MHTSNFSGEESVKSKHSINGQVEETLDSLIWAKIVFDFSF